MANEVTLEPTGRHHVWSGLTFNQMQMNDGYTRGSNFIFVLDGRPDVRIRRALNYYSATIGDRELPTKFREYETAARAIRKDLGL